MVVGVVGVDAAGGSPRAIRSKEGDTTPHIQPELGKPTKGLKHGRAKLVKARKGPQAPPAQPLRGTKDQTMLQRF